MIESSYWKEFEKGLFHPLQNEMKRKEFRDEDGNLDYDIYTKLLGEFYKYTDELKEIKNQNNLSEEEYDIVFEKLETTKQIINLLEDQDVLELAEFVKDNSAYEFGYLTDTEEIHENIENRFSITTRHLLEDAKHIIENIVIEFDKLEELNQANL